MKAKHSKRTGRFVRRKRPIKRKAKRKATLGSVARVLRKAVPNF